MKLISKIVGRAVMVRDANPFHHFEDGGCSLTSVILLLHIDWIYIHSTGQSWFKVCENVCVFKWGCGSLDKARHVYILMILKYSIGFLLLLS
jgi:hypothetical protein